MPRTVQEILDHSDELARRFEDYQPDPSDRRDPAALAAVRDAVIARSDAERALAAVVRAAHDKATHGSRSVGCSARPAKPPVNGTAGQAEDTPPGRVHVDSTTNADCIHARHHARQACTSA